MHENILFCPLRQLVLADATGEFLTERLVDLLGELNNHRVFAVLVRVVLGENETKRGSNAQQQNCLQEKKTMKNTLSTNT